MKHFVALFSLLPSLLMSQTQYTPQGTGVLPPGYTVNCIHPLNEQILWALASPTDGNSFVRFCRSTDGGNTWYTGSIDTAVKGLALDVFAQSENEAYANLENPALADRWYKTTDGGQTWYKLPEYLGILLHMYNRTEGVMSSLQSCLYSSDSFRNHTIVRSADPGGPPKGFGLRLLSGPNSRCANDSGVYFTYPNGYIIRTSDKGRTWRGLRAGKDTLNSTCGVAATGNTLIVIQWEKSGTAPKSMSLSTDAGNTWQDVSDKIPATVSSPRSIAAVPGREGDFILSGYSELFYSKDSGYTWTDLNPPTNAAYNYSGVFMMGSGNCGWMGMITNGNNDPLLYKVVLDPKTSLNTPHHQSNSGVYPNPANGHISVESDKSVPYMISDGLGKILKSGLLDTGTNVMDISDLPAGLYTLTTLGIQTSKTGVFRVY